MRDMNRSQPVLKPASGPKAVVVKRGEYGAALFTGNSYFAIPAYPLESVYDPTGAGGIGFVGDADDRYNTDANSIHFTTDVTDTAGTGNPDGLTDGPNEDIN